MINADDITRAYNRYYKIQDELWQIAGDMRDWLEIAWLSVAEELPPQEEMNEKLRKAKRAVERLKQLEKMKHGK